MKISEAAEFALRQIGSRYEEREASNICRILFEDLFDITNLRSEKSFEEEEELKVVLERLESGEPIQYIIGVCNFFGFDFKVNKHVLIPRPETEELVHWVLTDYKRSGKQLDVLDIGLGSGCIAVTIKKKVPRFRVFGIEKSIETLNVARINSRKLSAPVTFYAFDFLVESLWDQMGMFDIIVSNPPYIDPGERNVIADHVLLHEPEMALFAYDDSLIFYKKIQQFADKHLAETGSIYLELHEDHAIETAQIFLDSGYQTEIRKDLQGKDRMLKVIK